MDELTRERLGIITVHLALTFPVWICRRKTSFAFVDDTTVHRRQSVDFVLPHPQDFGSAYPTLGETLYVPLSIRDRASLVKFSIVDEEGTTLPLIRHADSAELAAYGFSALADGLNSQLGRPKGDAREQRRLLKQAFSASNGAQLLEQAAGTGAPLNILRADGEMGGVYDALMRELAVGVLMIVPIVYEPGVHRIVKMEHDAPMAWESESSKYAASRVGQRVLASLSLKDKATGVSGLDIGWARSTHVEFDSPEQVDLSTALMRCKQWDATVQNHVEVDLGPTDPGQPAVDICVQPRVEVDPRDPDDGRRRQMLRDLLLSRQDTARVRWYLRPSISSVTIPAAIASVATTAVLWMVHYRLGELDGETSVSLLLLFPAVAAVLFARPGEHAYATRLLKGVRWSAAIVAACALVAIAAISGGFIRNDGASGGSAVIECETRSVTGDPVRAVRARSLDCVEHRRRASEPQVRDDTRTVVTWVTRIATLVTIVIVLAMFLTYGNVRRRRPS